MASCERDIKPEIIRSVRKTISVEVTSDMRVIVRAPKKMKDSDIRRFLDEKSEWIRIHYANARERATRYPPLTQDEIINLRECAKTDISRRCEMVSARMGVKYGTITIRCQKKRWGSCSSKGNLNFNCLLMLCPDSIIDYIVIHELSHLIEPNHSKRFYAVVEKFCPYYVTANKWLKENGGAIIARAK